MKIDYHRIVSDLSKFKPVTLVKSPAIKIEGDQLFAIMKDIECRPTLERARAVKVFVDAWLRLRNLGIDPAAVIAAAEKTDPMAFLF